MIACGVGKVLDARAEVDDRPCACSHCASCSPAPFCRLMKRTPGHRPQRRQNGQRRQRSIVVVLEVGIALPHEADAERPPRARPTSASSAYQSHQRARRAFVPTRLQNADADRESAPGSSRAACANSGGCSSGGVQKSHSVAGERFVGGDHASVYRGELSEERLQRRMAHQPDASGAALPQHSCA